METKTKIGICIAQIVILAVFILLALGCGGGSSSHYPSGGSSYGGGSSYSSSSYSSSSSSSEKVVRAIRATLQGALCGGNGFVAIGYYDNPSQCSEACGSRGYTYYCTGEDTRACFCK